MSTYEIPTDPRIDALVQRFPRLFKGRPPRVASDLAQGWTEVMHRLFNDLDVMLDDSSAERFEVVQFKEKFGGLRVYWDLGDENTLVIDIHGPAEVQRIDQMPAQRSEIFDRIRARVRQAEAQAATTCQRCGNGSATAAGPGWIRTLCGPCRDKQRIKDQTEGV